MPRIIGLLIVLGLTMAGPAGPASAQVELHEEIAAAAAERGWWDETGSLDAERMDALVAEHDGTIAFAYTDRRFIATASSSDVGPEAAPLLAQAVLDAVGSTGSPVGTVLMVDGSSAGGASTIFAFSAVESALDAVDRADPEGSFATIAARLVDGPALDGSALGAEAETAAVFTFGRVLVLVLLSLAAAVLWMVYSSRRTRTRTAGTVDARMDTSAELAAMSNLILELEPRITIAENPDLKERYTVASKTYAEVLERAADATRGHEIADLRIRIAKARWRLDVIEAELDGDAPPPEPHSWDSSGSAWESTRGTGAGPR